MNNLILIFIVIIMLSLHMTYIRMITINRVNSLDLFHNKLDLFSKSIRKELAMDYHDDIGAHLSAFITLTNALKVTGYSFNKKQKRLISQIEDTSQRMLSSSKEFVWTLEPIDRSPIELLDYLRDLGNQLFHNSEIKFDFSNYLIKSCPANWNLPVKNIRDLIYIFREAMVNSLKHSKATKARLSGSWKEQKIKLIFTDDGNGIKNKRSTKTNGLHNLRERAKRLNANLRLISGEGGTSVSLEMSV